jgi:multidrug efflux system outer membrane protein
MNRNTSCLLAMILALGGCTMIPKYNRPELPVPGAWPESAAGREAAPSARAATEVGWEEYFSDAQLRKVIELALANNRDLRIAALNVERTQAFYRIQRSELTPAFGVLADGQRYRLPEKMSDDETASIVEQYSVNLGFLSWELDLFGRLRSLSASALEQYLATEQAAVATQTSLIAAVASTYLAVAADSEGLALARATLDAQQSSLDLILKSRDFGVASDLDLYQARSQVEVARAAVAAYTGRLAVDRNALDLLVGTPVGPELLPERLTGATELADISAGVPSEVLLRRPDIAAAEHQLIAANANIGAARAAFFPRITLTAALGTLSPDVSSLFESGTHTWSFAPQIVAPLFAGGSLKANLRATQVDREIAVAQYEKAIQVAFGEVSDALTLRTTLVDQRDAQAALVAALDQTYRLSDARYRAGIDGYLGVLVAQRSLFAAQELLVNVQLAELVNRVTLYKVLGGGA